MSAIALRVGGVPEHFNLPWHLAIEAGVPRDLGIDLTWRDYPDGSGAMAAALRARELDAAAAVFAASMAFHSCADGPWRRRLQRADHAAIYLFMAGTYTTAAIDA